MSLKSYTALKDLVLSDAIIEIAEWLRKGMASTPSSGAAHRSPQGRRNLQSHRWVVTCTRQICDSQLSAL